MKNPYSEWALNYDDVVTKYPVVRTIRFQEQTILYSLFKRYFKAKDDILDVGAGTGYYSLGIAKNVRSLTALDPSKEMLFILKNKISKNNIKNIHIINDDFLKHKFNKKFDNVISIGVLEIIKAPKEFIEKCLNLTKDNGVVIILVPNKSFWFGIYKFLFKLQNVKPNCYSEDQIKDWFKDYNVKTYETGLKLRFTKGLSLIAVIEKNKKIK